MSDIRIPQNPGISRLDEFTTQEQTFIQNLAGLSYATGDILYHNGVSLTRLPIGVAGQLLKVNSGATAPEWGSGTGLSIGDTITSATAGSILFAGTSGVLAQDNANLFWDNTNDRLGVRTTSPTHSLTFGSTSTGIALYNTSDQTTNYARGRLLLSSNQFVVGTERGGTDNGIPLVLQSVTNTGTASLTIQRTGNTYYNFSGGGSQGGSSATRVTLFGATFGSTSAVPVVVGIEPTINQSGTAGYVGLLINPTETTTGSGSKLLIDAQVGGIDRFVVENTGITTITNITDSSSVRILSLQGDRPTPATNDEIYQSFILSDSAGNQDEYARIVAQATDITSTSEDGQFKFAVMNAGSLTTIAQLNATSFNPNTNDARSLGTSTISWSDLFLASGGVINFNNGNATLTHSAGLLTSNVPLSLGTSNALTAGTLELGAATDTTRVSAGVIAVEGVTVPTISSTNTLTNKRITKRIQSTADTATLTITSDSTDVAIVTALAQAMTIAAPTGTPTQGQQLIIRIKDNGIARALTWNAVFRAIGFTLPTTTVISKTMYLGCMYNTEDVKWDVTAYTIET